MLDLNYRECKAQAMDSLTAKLPDFANYSAVDIAIMSKNKFFISHPCCQKYAYDLWYGNIRIRKRKIGCIELPEVMKVGQMILMSGISAVMITATVELPSACTEVLVT